MIYPLARPYFDKRDIAEIKKVLDSGWVSQGPKLKDFEQRVSAYLGVKYAIAVSNCTSALHLSLLACGVKENDEVIVADYTFPATAYAVLYCKAKPVFMDIDPQTYNINPDRIKERITNRTKAIIPVHAFGQSASMGRILAIARKRKLRVIEDAACALGAKYRGRFAGIMGDTGCFSLHARKGITSGEGGIVVTNDGKIASKIRSLSIYGTRKKCLKGKFLSLPEFVFLGYNYKMSDILAAVGMSQLAKLDKIIKKKRTLAAYWNRKLKKIKHVSPPFVDKNAYHIYQSYVALLDEKTDRDVVIHKLADRGIQAHIGTYALHKQPVFRSKSKLTNSYRVFKQALALPLYYTLTKKDIDWMAKNLKEILEGQSGNKE